MSIDVRRCSFSKREWTSQIHEISYFKCKRFKAQIDTALNLMNSISFSRHLFRVSKGYILEGGEICINEYIMKKCVTLLWLHCLERVVTDTYLLISQIYQIYLDFCSEKYVNNIEYKTISLYFIFLLPSCCKEIFNIR